MASVEPIQKVTVKPEKDEQFPLLTKGAKFVNSVFEAAKSAANGGYTGGEGNTSCAGTI